MTLFTILLLLHIFGAIIAFGPTFAFPLIGSMGGKEPMHANFATRVTDRIAHGMTLPLAIVQGITGLGLLLVSGRNLTDSHNYWLGVAIVLYFAALYVSIFLQTPRREARRADLDAAPAAGPRRRPVRTAPGDHGRGQGGAAERHRPDRAGRRDHLPHGHQARLLILRLNGPRRDRPSRADNGWATSKVATTTERDAARRHSPPISSPGSTGPSMSSTTAS